MQNDKTTPKLNRKMKLAMRLSLGAGFLFFLLKIIAYFFTRSTAVLSDATESLVHLCVVGFASYSLKLSYKPADKDHTYGHDRIAFFSAGVEGILIALAAFFILFEGAKKMFSPLELYRIDYGIICMSLVTIINGLLGFFLLEQGKKNHSLVLQADGKHLVTDCLTSLGVMITLLLTYWTKISFFDPLFALVIGVNILRTAIKLILRSIRGLMDEADPKLDKKIRQFMQNETKKMGIGFHNLRHRNCGNRILVEIHLLFPHHFSLKEAHDHATELEKKMEGNFEEPTELITHLEPLQNHDKIHQQILGRNDCII